MAGQILKTNFSLNDKYTLFEGRVILSGIQALVRLLLDQHSENFQAGSRSLAIL